MAQAIIVPSELITQLRKEFPRHPEIANAAEKGDRREADTFLDMALQEEDARFGIAPEQDDAAAAWARFALKNL